MSSTITILSLFLSPILSALEGPHSVCPVLLLYCHCCYPSFLLCERAHTLCVYSYTVIVAIKYSFPIPSVREGTHSVCLVLYRHCCYTILFPHSFCARGHTLCVYSTILSLLLFTYPPFLLCERAGTVCVQYNTVIVAIPHSFCVRGPALCVHNTILVG